MNLIKAVFVKAIDNDYCIFKKVNDQWQYVIPWDDLSTEFIKATNNDIPCYAILKEETIYVSTPYCVVVATYRTKEEKWV